MAKKKRNADSVPVVKADIQASTEPQPREFTPRPCCMCETRRPPRTNYSRVYCTRGIIRYIRCDFCKHTWSQEG